MPLYEYLCERCGPFTASRPMAQYRDPTHCPFCDHEAPRAILTAPAMATAASEIRHAHVVNERAAHAPKTSAEVRDTMRETRSHGAGCACCSGGTNKR